MFKAKKELFKPKSAMAGKSEPEHQENADGHHTLNHSSGHTHEISHQEDGSIKHTISHPDHGSHTLIHKHGESSHMIDADGDYDGDTKDSLSSAMPHIP